MLSWQLLKKLGLVGICVERRPSHLYHIDILGVFIQGLRTFLEREIVRLTCSYTITYLTLSYLYDLSVLIVEREENRSTRRKTLEAQERSTTQVNSHETQVLALTGLAFL